MRPVCGRFSPAFASAASGDKATLPFQKETDALDQKIAELQALRQELRSLRSKARGIPQRELARKSRVCHFIENQDLLTGAAAPESNGTGSASSPEAVAERLECLGSVEPPFMVVSFGFG